MLSQIQNSHIAIEDLFLNADSGFDTKSTHWKSLNIIALIATLLCHL